MNFKSEKDFHNSLECCHFLHVKKNVFLVLLYVYGDLASSLNNNHKFRWQGAKINHRSLSLDQKPLASAENFVF